MPFLLFLVLLPPSSSSWGVHYSLYSWRWPTFPLMCCYIGSSFDTKIEKNCYCLSCKAALDLILSTVKVTEPQFLRDMLPYIKGSVFLSVWGNAPCHLTISYTSATGNYKRTAQGRDLFNAMWHGLQVFFQLACHLRWSPKGVENSVEQQAVLQLTFPPCSIPCLSFQPHPLLPFLSSTMQVQNLHL